MFWKKKECDKCNSYQKKEDKQKLLSKIQEVINNAIAYGTYNALNDVLSNQKWKIKVEHHDYLYGDLERQLEFYKLRLRDSQEELDSITHNFLKTYQ